MSRSVSIMIFFSILAVVLILAEMESRKANKQRLEIIRKKIEKREAEVREKELAEMELKEKQKVASED